MGKVREIQQNLWFETKRQLPFEDNAFLDEVPYFVTVSNAKTNEELEYLKSHKAECEQEKRRYKDFLEANSIKDDCENNTRINFDKLIYRVCNTGTGKSVPHYYCSISDFKYPFLSKNFPKEYIFNHGNPIDKKNKPFHKVFTTEIIGDTLVFRFFVYKVDFFIEENIKGYYETYRICFRGMESWGENREKLYRFDNRYVSEMKKNAPQFEYTVMNVEKVFKDIFKVFPYITSTTPLYFSKVKNLFNGKIEYKINYKPFEKESKIEVCDDSNLNLNEKIYYNTKIENANVFSDFCKGHNKLNKNENLFKNVPDYIVQDCKKQKTRPVKLTNRINTIISVAKEDYQTYNTSFNYNNGVIVEKKDDYILVRGYHYGNEVERIYYTKDKIYKVVYNFFLNKFVSTKNEHMFIFTNVVVENIVAPFYVGKVKVKDEFPFNNSVSTSFSMRFDKEICSDFVKGTILSRYVPMSYNNIWDRFNGQNYFYNIEFQSHYLFLEQMLKLGYESMYNDIVKNFDIFRGHMLNVRYNKKKYRNFTIRTLPNANVSEIFFVNGSWLKKIDKEIGLWQWVKYIEKFNGIWLNKAFKNYELKFQLSLLDIDDNKIKKIIRQYKTNNKDYEQFFINLFKNKTSVEVARLVDLYCDYFKFKDKANRYNVEQAAHWETLRARYENNVIELVVADNEFIQRHYPDILKPSEISFMHDKAYRDYLYYQTLHRASSKVSIEEKFLKFATSEEYTKFLYNGDEQDDYMIMPAKISQDLIFEGESLHHCVGGYIGSMANGKSYIYFLREKKNKEKPFFTIEINCNKNIIYDEKKRKDVEVRTYTMQQCYGAHDEITKSNECRAFIKKWCKEKKIKIGCRI